MVIQNFFSFLRLQVRASDEYANGIRVIEDGAIIPIRVGFGDIGASTGIYWANDTIWGKGDGKIQAW